MLICGDKQRYRCTSKQIAETECSNNGMYLCSREEVKNSTYGPNYNSCTAGWTSDSGKGYVMRDIIPGCGNRGTGWLPWIWNANAFCCSYPEATEVDPLKDILQLNVNSTQVSTSSLAIIFDTGWYKWLNAETTQAAYKLKQSEIYIKQIYDIKIADETELVFGNDTADSAFSLCVWAKLTDVTESALIGKHKSSSHREYAFTFTSSN